MTKLWHVNCGNSTLPKRTKANERTNKQTKAVMCIRLPITSLHNSLEFYSNTIRQTELCVSVGSSGQLWAALGSSGQLWAALGSSGQLWAAVGSSRQLWAARGSCGQLWAALGSCGQLWAAVGSCGQAACVADLALQ